MTELQIVVAIFTLFATMTFFYLTKKLIKFIIFFLCIGAFVAYQLTR